MMQQVAKVVNEGVESIKVICGYTYVFILLVYHFTELQCNLTMESTSSMRAVIDIGATASKHEGIIR